MDLQTAKQIILTLNRDAFSKFVFEMWKLLDCADDLKYKKTQLKPEVGNNIYEQHFWGKQTPESIYDYQGYHLIIPYFQPIELFASLNETSFADPDCLKKLKKYKRIVEKRIEGWQFWTDGNYIMPNIHFVTNLEGVERDFYQDIIIPSFEQLLGQINLIGNTAVGSCDSFFELDSKNTIQALQNFISTYQKQISISLSNDRVDVDYFNSDKYLTKGLLINSKNPYETICIEKKEKSEIIKEFEFLIITKISEPQLEKFIKKYYREIFGEKYNRIETQLWLGFPELDIENKNRRLDIFLRNSIERDWELFELKKPQKLTRTYRDIPTFRAEIYCGIQQLKNYEKLLSQDRVKQKFAKEGIEYYHPEFRLVIGNKPDITVEQWRFLKATNENRIKIITFEDLILEMKARYVTHMKYVNEKDKSSSNQ